MRKILRWVGSKASIIDLVKSKMPENIRTYIEPFCGSIAVGLEVKAEHRIFNDFNICLINFFKAVKTKPEELKMMLKEYQDEYNALETLENKKEYYLAKREEFNRLKNDDIYGLRTAALFKLMNATGFSGMYRENNKNHAYNIPFGQKKSIELVDDEIFSDVSAKLEGCTLKTGDFAECCDYSKLGEGDCVYMDVPYDSTFDDYNAGGFGKAGQIRAFELFKQLDAQGVRVILSNNNTEFIRGLFKDYTVEIIPVRHGLERKTVEEVLIYN